MEVAVPPGDLAAASRVLEASEGVRGVRVLSNTKRLLVDSHLAPHQLIQVCPPIKYTYSETSSTQLMETVQSSSFVRIQPVLQLQHGRLVVTILECRVQMFYIYNS